MIRIRWHGHSCFEIGNDLTIVTDPHDGRSIGIEPPRVKGDIILISHSHYDHDKGLRITEKPDSVAIKEEAGEREIKGVRILGIGAFHDDAGGSKRGKIVIYRFELDGISFCHMGDIGHLPGREIVDKIKGVDILFVPVGGVFTVDARGAWEIIDMVSPRVAIPMHYKVSGLSIPVAHLCQFTKGHDDQIVNVGNEIEVDRSDLPDEFEVWSFSRD